MQPLKESFHVIDRFVLICRYTHDPLRVLTVKQTHRTTNSFGLRESTFRGGRITIYRSCVPACGLSHKISHSTRQKTGAVAHPKLIPTKVTCGCKNERWQKRAAVGSAGESCSIQCHQLITQDRNHPVARSSPHAMVNTRRMLCLTRPLYSIIAGQLNLQLLEGVGV